MRVSRAINTPEHIIATISSLSLTNNKTALAAYLSLTVNEATF